MPYNYNTNGGIPYEELAGSPTYRVTRDGLQATQVYRMPWTSIDAFMEESFPLPVRAGFAYEFTLERTFPTVAWLFTRSVHIEPFDPETPSLGIAFNTYPTGARVTIEYATKPREEEEDGTLRTHRLSIGGEVMIIPNHSLGWWVENAGATPPPASFVAIQSEDVRAPRILPTIEHSLTFEYVPDPPFTAMRDKLGMVNNLAATLFDAPLGTLLFLGADAHRRVTPQGEDAWKLEYRFSQRAIKGKTPAVDDWPIPWYFFWDSKNGWWDELVDKNDNPVYGQTDFADLFQAEGAGEA